MKNFAKGRVGLRRVSGQVLRLWSARRSLLGFLVCHGHLPRSLAWAVPVRLLGRWVLCQFRGIDWGFRFPRFLFVVDSLDLVGGWLAVNNALSSLPWTGIFPALCLHFYSIKP